MRQNKFGHHEKDHICTCSICCSSEDASHCSANQTVCQHITSLWESILCPKLPNSEYHAKKCYLGECSQCGVRKLTFCPSETAMDSKEVAVKVFMDIRTGQVDEGGSEKKRKDLLLRRMQSVAFLDLFSAHLTNFIKHNFVFRWQAQQFKECLLNFPSNVVVSVIDFAENYSFKIQNEIQSMHWWSAQVTILVHITYLRNDAGDVEKTLHFYISDDKHHDTLFVQHCFMLHDKWLNKQGHCLQHHWVWSDGAASQFKARRPFYFVARYYQITGLQMMHNFFASGHGKGEHDGAGAVIKRTLTHEQLKPDGWPMKCAADVVNFLNATFQPIGKTHRCNTQRVFWLVSKDDVQHNLQWDCERISGSRSFHCVDGYSKDDRCAVRFRTLSCFCEPCMSGLWRRCKNRMHIEEWKYVSIEPLPESDNIASDEDQDDDEDDGYSNTASLTKVSNLPMYEGSPEMLCQMLSIGDNFAVKAAEEKEDFYLLKCTRNMYQAERVQKDKWHNKIVKGGNLVEGFYYGQAEGKVDTYNLLHHTSPVMIYSHLVRAIRFPMEPTPGIQNEFKLPTEVYENIYNSMPYDDDSDQGASMLHETQT